MANAFVLQADRTTGPVMRYDRAIGDAAAPLRDSAAMAILGPLSDAADQWQLFTICAVTTATGAFRDDRNLVRTGVHMALAMLAATVLKNVVKNRVDRTRPLVVAEGGDYLFQPGDHDISELNSFPSGHTAGAVAVARAVGRHYPRARPAAAGVAAAIAAIQVPRAKHYPLDLAAGLIVGLVAETIARRLLKVVPPGACGSDDR